MQKIHILFCLTDASISYVHPTLTLTRWPHVIPVGKTHLHKYITSPIMSEIFGINLMNKTWIIILMVFLSTSYYNTCMKTSVTLEFLNVGTFKMNFCSWCLVWMHNKTQLA